MPSSVSANIIMQLGYVQNYAMKGHFLTSEIVLGIRFCLFPARTNLKYLHFTHSAYKQRICTGCGAHRLVLPELIKA